MKRKNIAIYVFLALGGISTASTYTVIVEQEKNKYDIVEKKEPVISEWYDIGSEYDCVARLDPDDYDYGEQFTQIEDCSQDQERTITTVEFLNGEERTVVEKENKTIPVEITYIETGTGLSNSCKEILDRGQSVGTGYYNIKLSTGVKSVMCDMDTDGGGWTVFQNRVSNTDFYKSWSEYKTGFGDSTNFWLGNEIIQEMTSSPKEMRVLLTNHSNTVLYANYSSFKINNESDYYRLNISGYSGNATDSLTFHSGKPFSAKDRDNDLHDNEHCAVRFKGAWWYESCHISNLNGLYLNGNHSSYADGMNWASHSGYYYSFKATRMMFR